MGKKLTKKKVKAFHLCSFSTGNHAGELTPIRAKEIQLAVSYFIKRDVKPGNIFVFGQSRGGWSTLYFAAKNKNKNWVDMLFFPLPFVTLDPYDAGVLSKIT